MADKGLGEASSEKPREEAAMVDVVYVDLPAPPGWQKKFMPKKGGIPKRNEIVFISPTGEEIKNRRELDRYIKSHSGCPPLSDFDWGSGDSPRRSARIIEKAKAKETPKGEKLRKRARTIIKRGPKGKMGGKNDNETVEKKEDAGGAEGADAEMKDTNDGSKDKDDIDTNEGSAEQVAKGEGPPVDVALIALGSDSGNNQGKIEDKTALEPDEKNNEPEEECKTQHVASVTEVVPPAIELEGDQEAPPPANGSFNNKEVTDVPKEVPSVNRDEGQHQPKTSTISC